MVDKPDGWTPEWQAALIKAKLEVPCFRTGLTTAEFAELAGVGVVNKAAKQGIEAFKKRFGEGCNFEEVGSGKQPFRRICTFSGYIHPSIWKSPCPEVITPREFVTLHHINSGVELLARYARRGHVWFRRRFPGWDFLELKATYSSSISRWYGRIEDIGEQEEEPIPNDNLTASQFARLQGLSESGVRLMVRRGSQTFSQQFPGWSFCFHGQKAFFYRLGNELEILTIPQFAKRMEISTSPINSLVNQGRLSERFPDWKARLTGLKSPKWFIYRCDEETALPPEGAMSLKEFADAARMSEDSLGERVRRGELSSIYPEWKTQRDKRNYWAIYPENKDVPLPPRTIVEIENLLTVKQFIDLFHISQSAFDLWIKSPSLFAVQAPGWSIVQLPSPLHHHRIWLKPPQ
jgi:hypothetical protein